MWFQQLTGIKETSPNQVRAQLELCDNSILSKANGAKLIFGKLETPTLAELRSHVNKLNLRKGKLKITETVDDVGQLHTKLKNKGALFQVASQFNLLEMSSPNVTPEQGIGGYEHDHTQGPACAIACGAGTIYRNYFAPLSGQVGQSFDQQIDTIKDLGLALGNTYGQLWEMRNGYVLVSESGLKEITHILKNQTVTERDILREKLRIGIQWDTQVTRDGCQHLVTQVYGSALPVAYSPYSSRLWSEFAKLILEASYEATLCAAAINVAKTGNKLVYLTLLGGGTFGNHDTWIFDAIQRAIGLFGSWGLDVAIVSYRNSKPKVIRFVDQVTKSLN
jgi:hypothetical protein